MYTVHEGAVWCLTCAFSQRRIRCQPVWTADFTLAPEQELTRMTMCAEVFTETGSAVLLAPCRPKEIRPIYYINVHFILSTLSGIKGKAHPKM